jgi:hypothetical protein
VDISSRGARLSNSSDRVRLGEVLDIRYGQREAIFRLVWIGPPGAPTVGNVGLECLSPETNRWDLDLSSRTDDEPLMQEIVVAHNVQRQLFPRRKPPLPTLNYSGKCVQARTVGGDYYDFLEMGRGRVGFVLADVVGKGVAAALPMANLQGSLHNRAEASPSDLPDILAAVNRHLYEHTEANRYATVFFGCYDDDARRLAYVNCGHIPPLLLRECGTVKRLDATGTVVGLFGNWDCSVHDSNAGRRCAQYRLRRGYRGYSFRMGMSSANRAFFPSCGRHQNSSRTRSCRESSRRSRNSGQKSIRETT